MKKLMMALAAVALVGAYAHAAPNWSDPTVTTWEDGAGAPDVSGGVQPSSDIDTISWYYDTTDDMVYFQMELYGSVAGTDPTSNSYQWYINTDADNGTGASWADTVYIVGNTEGQIQDPHDGYPNGIDAIVDVHKDPGFGNLDTVHQHDYDGSIPYLFNNPAVSLPYFVVSGDTIVVGIPDTYFTQAELANIENWVVWGGTQNLGPGVASNGHDVSPIPEPSTFALVGLGAAAIVLRRRLRRS